MICMDLRKKIYILSIFIIFISIFGASYALNHQNTNNNQVFINDNNDTDIFGCCSIVLQEDGSDSIMTFRRDSNITADIHIENVNWHGIPAIKQYKTDEGYFSHVIITKDGWMIGFGGIDDGADSEKCENITAEIISDDYSISEEKLVEIQKIKQKYGRGHVLIKAPNGNFGFACVDKVKTGKIEPGQYISLPNNYSLSRSGELSLSSDDLIKDMNELAQSDLYGLDRRDIVTYDYHSGNESYADVYVSNEDGSYLDVNYTGCVDNIYLKDNLTKAEDIPIAPAYKSIGTMDFTGTDSPLNLINIAIYIAALILIVGVSFVSYKFVRFIRHKN